MPGASSAFRSTTSGVIPLAALPASWATQTAPGAKSYLPVTSAGNRALESAAAVTSEAASIWSVVGSPNDRPEATGIIDDVLWSRR
jgi:hypothetical protein